jgi:hypothetical protein
MSEITKLKALIDGFAENVYFAEYKKEIIMHFNLEHPIKKYIYHLNHFAFYNIYIFGQKHELKKVFGSDYDFISKKELLERKEDCQNIYSITNFYSIKTKEENYYSPNASKHLKQRLKYNFEGIDDKAKLLPKFTKKCNLYYEYGTEYILYDNYYLIDGIDKNLNKLLFQIMYERYKKDYIYEFDFDDEHYNLLKNLSSFGEDKKKSNLNKIIDLMDMICSHKHPPIKNIYCVVLPITLYYHNNYNLIGYYYAKLEYLIRSSDEEIEKFLILNKNFYVKEIFSLDNKDITNNIKNTNLICQIKNIKNYYYTDSILFDSEIIPLNQLNIHPDILPYEIKLKLKKIENKNINFNTIFNTMNEVILQDYKKKESVILTITESHFHELDILFDKTIYNDMNDLPEEYFILKEKADNLLKDDTLIYNIKSEENIFTEKIITNGDKYKKLILVTNNGIEDKLFLDYNPDEPKEEVKIEYIVTVYYIDELKNTVYKAYGIKVIKTNISKTELNSLLSKINIYRLFKKNESLTINDDKIESVSFIDLFKISTIYSKIIESEKITDYVNTSEKIKLDEKNNIDFYKKYPELKVNEQINMDLEKKFIKNGIFIKEKKPEKNVIFLSKDQRIINDVSDTFSDQNSDISSVTILNRRELPKTPYNTPIAKNDSIQEEKTINKELNNSPINNRNNAESQGAKSININPRTQTKPISFEEVFEIIRDSYNFDKAIGSTILDIISVYLKGQKILYIEAKSYCEKHLYSLMLPAIFITTVCSVVSGIFQDVTLASIIVSGLTALNSFILSVITYLKLDAKAEAHKMTAYAFEKLQSECEFFSAKVMFSQMDNDDKNDISIEEIIKFISKTEKKVREIREKNQFILPESVRHRFRQLYSVNLFSRVKQVQTEELVKINQLKTKINKVLETKKSLIECVEDTEKQQNQDKLKILLKEQNDLLKEIIAYRKFYIDIGDEFDKEILDNINNRYNFCSCLAT